LLSRVLHLATSRHFVDLFRRSDAIGVPCTDTAQTQAGSMFQLIDDSIKL